MSASVAPILARLNQIILGKEAALKLVLACLLARGHLLIEDLPGMGKTTLALSLARVLCLQFQRVQFTSDLLPADIIGASIFDSAGSAFRFIPGPIFAQLVLADEINRASPKTQSALLEAMEEHQVTAEGETRPLPEPFFVIATQNPTFQLGTFTLPESQLDRFLMRLSLGYPSAAAERQLLLERDRRDLLQSLTPVIDGAQLQALQQQVQQIRVTPPLVDYIVALVQRTRELPGLRQGLSPRAGLALRRAAQAWAFIEGHSGVIPEDVQAVFAAVVSHRLHAAAEREGAGLSADAILASVAIP